ALLRAAVQRQRPAGGDRLDEVIPLVGAGGVRVPERGGALEQQVLERRQLVRQPRGRAVERDRLLALAQPAHHHRRARGQVTGAELEPNRRAAQLPLVELEPGRHVCPAVDVNPDPRVGQPRDPRPPGPPARPPGPWPPGMPWPPASPPPTGTLPPWSGASRGGSTS